MSLLERVRPRYHDASLIDVLPGVLAALGAPHAVDRPDPLGLTAKLAGVRRIGVLLIDGFGYHQIPAAAGLGGTLADIHAGSLGETLRLTSGFPSTTPASLVSASTGVPPGTHGVLGFSIRVPGEARVVNHIRWRDDPDPYAWQPVPTVFQRAASAGIEAYVVNRRQFEGSGLTLSSYRGAIFRPADDVEALGTEMLAVLGEGGGPALVYGYHPDVDRAGHAHGVASPQWAEQARLVDDLLGRLVAGLPADTALLVTADHGQLDVPREGRFDLDRDPRLRAGLAVVAGEARVRHLHTVEGATDDVAAVWRGILGDAASVMTRDEVIAQGWFGPVRPANLGRIGDLVVACRDRHVVVASVTDRGESRLVGYHGSWTAIEMEVPLMIVRGDR